MFGNLHNFTKVNLCKSAVPPSTIGRGRRLGTLELCYPPPSVGGGASTPLPISPPTAWTTMSRSSPVSWHSAQNAPDCSGAVVFLGFFAGPVIVNRRISQFCVRRAYRNCLPFFLGACVIYIGQPAATIERRISYARDTVGDYDVRQATATMERPIGNARNAVGDRDTRQASATKERSATYA